MVTLGMVLVGMIAVTRLPQELFPAISFPQITVVTDYSNAAPEEIETLITKPLEEALGSVAGLKRIESVSREGRSTVIVSFDWGQNIDFAALSIREKIDQIKDRFPKESEDPVVLKFDPLTRPILILSVTGPNLEPLQLKLLAEKMIKDNLEKVEGVASVSLSGGVTREILVEIDQSRLEANHLSLLEVVRSIEEANVSYPAGSIKKGLYEYLIRTMGEFKSVKEIEFAVAGVDIVGNQKPKNSKNTFVEKGEEGPRQTIDTLRSEVRRQLLEKRLVLVRDIAKVTDGFADRTSVSRYNGKSNIALSIQKQAGANTITVVNRLKETLSLLDEDIKTRGVQCDIIYDHSVFIRDALNNLYEEATQGAFLSFVTLFIFLQTFGPSFVVCLSLPITVLGVFIFMQAGGISLNIMSLGGLALGIGMIMDTSVVVMENIFRRRQMGEDAEKAAIGGTNEMIWPVVSSNLTTMAVFFPLVVFVPGVAGQLFKDLSWSIIYSQIISTIVPITLVTMLSVYLKVKTKEFKPIVLNGFMRKSLLETKSEKKQNTFLVILLMVVLGIFILSLQIFPHLEKEVLPKVDQGQFLIQINLPIGTRIEVTDRVCRRLEKMIGAQKNVKDLALTIGAEKGKKGQVSVDTLRPSQATIMVSLKAERDQKSADVIDELQKASKAIDLEGAEINYIMQGSEFQFAGGSSKPVLVEVKGYDFKKMDTLVNSVKKKLGEVKGIVDIQDDRAEAIPETKLDIDKKRASLYGISALDISLTAKAAIDGVVATQYREGGKEFDVRVRLSNKDRDNIENLNHLLMYSQVTDALIPLKAVASISKGLGPSEIKRADQERTVTVSADIDKKANSNDVLAAVQKFLATLEIPSDFQVKLSGKAREVKENFSKVTFAFILALLLNYMIMASQFENLTQPFVIMFTVPLAMIGMLIAMVLTGTTINVISLLGLIVLAGTAVNNGIVLIECINQLRDEGMELVAAAMEAVRIRTRPILMSTVASVVGLAPLALGLGEGSELRRPLAVTTMGGLISSTFLTLFVIPSLYILVTRLTEHFFGNPLEELEEEIDEAQP